MLCKSYIRSVIVQAGNIVTSTKARVHFNNTDRICVLANSWNRAFRSSLRMMVDTGATDEQGSVFDVLPDKDEDGEYTSGGCKSEGGELSCGYSSFRGKRATMEDFYDVKMSKIDGQTVCLFGIFDGHGGSRAAQYLKEHLFQNLMKHPQFMTDTKLAISESYQQTDADFLDSERDIYRDDGSTASTAVLVGNHLYVANVGDSRTVISKAGKAIALSEDHKPNRSDERKRIESAGGFVMWTGTWRVGGVLAMSRAFGNRMLKQYVVAEPEIQDLVVDEDFEFLVLASDGVWDVLPNEVKSYPGHSPVLPPSDSGMSSSFAYVCVMIRSRFLGLGLSVWLNPGSLRIYFSLMCQVAVEVAKTEEEPEAAARKLTAVAFSRGSADNITCIVVKFQHDKAGPASPHQD